MRIVISVLIWVFCTSVFAQSANTLSVLKPGSSEAAVVLVNGINSNADFFHEWVDGHTFGDMQVYAFNVAHRNFTMTESAEALVTHITALAHQGVKELTIFAHSMGGLVANKALHEAAEKGYLNTFETVTLKTMATPWGGFSKATPAKYIPAAEFFCRLATFPMCVEISPDSSFMTSLSKPFAYPVNFQIVRSFDDSVANPETDKEKSRFNAILATANMDWELRGLTHNDFEKIALVGVF